MEKFQSTHIKNPNIKDNWNLNPRCLSGDRSPAYVNSGHISPCCWVDGDPNQKEEGYKELFTDDMKLDNFETVDEVFSSEAWINFFLMLKTNPKSAPNICWKHCGHFMPNTGQKTPMRDMLNTKEYRELENKYNMSSARNRCVDGLSARLMKK